MQTNLLFDSCSVISIRESKLNKPSINYSIRLIIPIFQKILECMETILILEKVEQRPRRSCFLIRRMNHENLIHLTLNTRLSILQMQQHFVFH